MAESTRRKIGLSVDVIRHQAAVEQARRERRSISEFYERAARYYLRAVQRKQDQQRGVA